jgi:NADPH:quinone reductase-like Zn-dependent oxidoreductase
VIPLALDTAAVGLYSSGDAGFGLSLPSLSPKPSGKTIVVWGGSSSVGALAIQLAVASGAKVVTTASSHNFDFVKKAYVAVPVMRLDPWLTIIRSGATEAFDYKKDSVIDDVVNAVKSVGGEFAGLYDAISLEEDSYKYTVPIVEKLGGGVLSVVLSPPKDVPSSVKPANVFGINELTHQIWEEYVTQALQDGKLRPIPEPLIVGKGLESVQAGLDANKKGVSAKKVVVELD